MSCWFYSIWQHIIPFIGADKANSAAIKTFPFDCMFVIWLAGVICTTLQCTFLYMGKFFFMLNDKMFWVRPPQYIEFFEEAWTAISSQHLTKDVKKIPIWLGTLERVIKITYVTLQMLSFQGEKRFYQMSLLNMFFCFM